MAVVGAAGGLGSLAIQYAKAMGLQVIALDSGEEKKKLCEKYGVKKFVDFATSENLAKDVKDATEDGLGPHAVLMAASNEDSINQAVNVRTVPESGISFRRLILAIVCSTKGDASGCWSTPGRALSYTNSVGGGKEDYDQGEVRPSAVIDLCELCLANIELIVWWVTVETWPRHWSSFEEARWNVLSRWSG